MKRTNKLNKVRDIEATLQGLHDQDHQSPVFKWGLDAMENIVSRQAPKKKQGLDKNWKYVRELLKKEAFILDITEFKQNHIDKDGNVIKKPKITIKTFGAHKVSIQFNAEIANICIKYKLHPVWTEFILNFIFTGETAKPANYDFLNQYGQCDIACITDLGLVVGQSSIEEHQFFPIAIKISPHASQREVIDFIKEKFETNIKPLQRLFLGDQIIERKSRIRSEVLEQVRDYVWLNKKMNREALAKLVNEKFNTGYVYSDINQIIKDEKKRRT